MSGGVFASIDNDWPPVIGMRAEQLFTEFLSGVKTLCSEQKWDAKVVSFAKEQHLQRMKDSKQFQYCREITLHSVEQGNADRLVALALCVSSLFTSPHKLWPTAKRGLVLLCAGVRAMRRPLCVVV